ncbi:MAG TPA: myo-inosose-2 dehydratase [Xanthomonadales bacterium]|nr:myo-inosose-2 dehydratase [Xanthomonadales bacterium]
MNPSIGINPISWTNDDLQYVGGEVSLQSCLSQAKQAGFEGVELGHKFPRDAAKLKPILAEHGLRLVSGWYSCHLLGQDAKSEARDMQAHASLLQAMGCRVIIFAEVTGCIHGEPNTRLSQRPKISSSEWRQFGQRMSETAKVAADYGLELCYHHHMGTVVQSAEDIDALMEHTTDDVRLLLDSGHARFAGADPVQLAKTYLGRIGHVHCKDIRPQVLAACLNRDCSFLDAVLDGVFTVPGDGFIDFPGIFRELARIDYSGWIVVEAEQDPSVAPSLHYASLGHQNLQAIVGGATAPTGVGRR